MVLSKFLTFTVVRLISIKSPSAPNFSIVIQSPMRTISFTETCILATKPKIVSLKTKIKIADAAPKVARNCHMDCPDISEKMLKKPINHAKIIMTCPKLSKGLSLKDSLLFR